MSDPIMSYPLGDGPTVEPVEPIELTGTRIALPMGITLTVTTIRVPAWIGERLVAMLERLADAVAAPLE